MPSLLLTEAILDLSSVIPRNGEGRVSLYCLTVVGYGAREVHTEVLDVASTVVGVCDGRPVLAGVMMAIYKVSEEKAGLF